MAREKVSYLSSKKTGFSQIKMDEVEARLDAPPEYTDYVKRSRGLNDCYKKQETWTPKRPRDIPDAYKVTQSLDGLEDPVGLKR